jgi:uncharacterized protein YndB with AHSA1/START domain
MAAMTNSYSLSKLIQATPQQLYLAATNAMMVRRWLANGATVNATVGAPFLLTWNQGYFASGKFTALEENERVAFTWHGDGEPAASTVEMTFTPEGDGTRLDLVHSDLGSGEAWDNLVSHLKEGWETALDNLEYLFETGLDLRLMSRPMVGIYPGLLDANTAETLGVPVAEGIIINSVLEGGAAAAAGLQDRDVIARMGEQEIKNFADFNAVISTHKAGDTIELGICRGPENRAINLTFGTRPAPTLPESPEALAEQMREDYDQLISELESIIADVDEATLSKNPAEGQWSVRQNIAHLIWTERWQHMLVWGLNGGNDQVPWPDNSIVQIGAIDGAYETTDDLFQAYVKAKEETVAMLRVLPASAVDNKSTLAAIVLNVTSLPVHDRQHFQQMRDVLAALEKAVSVHA